MNYMNKRPSRIQEQFYFSKSAGACNNFQSRLGWRLPEVAGSLAPTPIHLPLKVHGGGGFNIRPDIRHPSYIIII